MFLEEELEEIKKKELLDTKATLLSVHSCHLHICKQLSLLSSHKKKMFTRELWSIKKQKEIKTWAANNVATFLTTSGLQSSVLLDSGLFSSLTLAFLDFPGRTPPAL